MNQLMILQALSQRSPFLDSVSRSIHQITHATASSQSLKHKAQRLELLSRTRFDEVSYDQRLSHDETVSELTSSIKSRLWQQLQRNCANKSTPFQACMPNTAQASSQTNSDGISEEIVQREEFPPMIAENDLSDASLIASRDGYMLFEGLASASAPDREPYAE